MNQGINFSLFGGITINIRRFSIIGVVILIISSLGGFYAYLVYSENMYYENYRFAVFYGAEMENITNQSDFNFNTSALDGKKMDQNMKNAAQDSKNQIQTEMGYQSKYQDYVKEMVKYANSNEKKQYAQAMLDQSNKNLDYMNTESQIDDIILNTNWNNSDQANDANKELYDLIQHKNDLVGQMSDMAKLRVNIRAMYPEFTKKLNVEYESANSAMLQ